MAQTRIRIVFVSLLFLAVNLIFLAAPRASYNAVVVHHTASNTSDYRAVRRAHYSRGWFEIAYHFVLSNGSTDIPFGHLYPTRRYTLGIWSVATRSLRFNRSALHLSVVGNFEESTVPPRLQRALGHALAELMSRHDIPPENIFLHRDCGATACPGKNVDKAQLVAWTLAGQQADPAVKAQHLTTLDQFHLSPAWYNTAWLVFNLVLLGYYFYGGKRRSHNHGAGRGLWAAGGGPSKPVDPAEMGKAVTRSGGSLAGLDNGENRA